MDTLESYLLFQARSPQDNNATAGEGKVTCGIAFEIRDEFGKPRTQMLQGIVFRL